MITERQAWLKMAEEWDAAYDDNGDGTFAVSSRETGLCPHVDVMPVSASIRESMDSKLREHLPTKRVTKQNHRWPVNADGAKKRAAFCRRMAALCMRKKVKAKT